MENRRKAGKDIASHATDLPRSYIPPINLTAAKQLDPGPVNDVVYLSLNESSFGPSPLSLAACAPTAEMLLRYPDRTYRELRSALGRRHGISPDRIVCGAGSEEILDAVCRAFTRSGDEILFPEFSFILFRILANRTGATVVTAREPDFTVDVDLLLKQVTPRTRVVMLANPGNPTGTFIPASEVRRLHAALRPDIVLVLDSAYAEYVTASDYDSGVELAENTDNVIVTRTFSKIFGMAAMRVGWAYCSPALAAAVNRARATKISTMAQLAAIAALEDKGFTERIRDQIAVMRETMTARLSALGLNVLPSQTNFLTVGFPGGESRGGKTAEAYMAWRGIVTRGVEDYRMPDFIRITLGDETENRRVIETLTEFVQ